MKVLVQIEGESRKWSDREDDPAAGKVKLKTAIKEVGKNRRDFANFRKSSWVSS